MRYNIKSVFAVVIIASSLTFGQSSNSNKSFVVQIDSIAPDHSGMSELTSAEFSKDMVPGWNVGNSLEAIGGETAWGNPKITQELIDSVKDAGFRSVRIPVGWRKYSNEESFTIQTSWLDRVEEVVNYVLNAGMYAIINEHWDRGWIIPNYANQDTVITELTSMWEQIAIRFRDYDDHLLFAGTNEIMIEGDYGTPKKEYYTVQNSYNQAFVNAVRSTGGRNYYRYLLVQGFNTNIDYTDKFFVMPTDVEEKRLMVEVHYYDPYNFTLNSGSNITQWGRLATDSKKTETWANEAYADGQFKKMKTKFYDKGYAVILGEYGVVARLDLGSEELNDEFEMFRQYYIAYITNSLFEHGLVPVYWDNGYTGNDGMGLFDRSTGAQAYPNIINTIIEACDSNSTVGVLEKNEPPSKFSLMQNYPNPFNPTTRITYSLPHLSKVTLRVFDVLGREVDTLIENRIVNSGLHEVAFDAFNLPSGIYFYSLYAGNYINTKKMLLLR